MTEDSQSSDAVNLVQLGSEIAGGAAGAAIGLFGGPVGAIIGGASGPMIVHAVWAATEFAKRQLGHREKVRVGATIAFAIEKIRQNRDQGLELRNDGFFDEKPHERSTADEVAEGVLLAAQGEYQEKKLKYYGNMLANIAFRPDISRSTANSLLKFAEILSYRQLCYIAFTRRKSEFDIDSVNLIFYISLTNTKINDNILLASLASDIYNLFQNNILMQDINPLNVPIHHIVEETTRTGSTLYDLMNLDEIDYSELDDIFNLLSDMTKLAKMEK